MKMKKIEQQKIKNNYFTIGTNNNIARQGFESATTENISIRIIHREIESYDYYFCLAFAIGWKKLCICNWPLEST
jgi:hypothetical protein